MKFLCVECDEAMTLSEARGPDDGAMTVVFQCPACGRETAMLTNPMETQVVRSLGVSIGEQKEPSGPMAMVRSSLAASRDGSEAEESLKQDTSQESRSGSKCPFTDVVESAAEEQEEPTGLQWTADAEKRLERIPPFARAMARKSIEQHAREQGYTQIDERVMDQVRGQFGM